MARARGLGRHHGGRVCAVGPIARREPRAVPGGGMDRRTRQEPRRRRVQLAHGHPGDRAAGADAKHPYQQSSRARARAVRRPRGWSRSRPWGRSSAAPGARPAGAGLPTQDSSSGPTCGNCSGNPAWSDCSSEPDCDQQSSGPGCDDCAGLAWGAPVSTAGDLYAGPKGEVYRRSPAGGWEQHGGASWQPAAPAPGLDREFQARSMGEARSRGFQSAGNSRGGSSAGQGRQGGRR